jgi:hypothetical protein
MTLIKLNAETIEKGTLPCVDLKNPNSSELFTYNRDWLLDRFEEGMVIIKLDTPKDAFIEFVPAEFAWKPIYAPGYTLINHVYVAEDGPEQWLKSELLQTAETNCSKTNGMVIMLENEVFNKDRDFFIQRGYLEHAHIPGFTMLVKRFKTEIPAPAFSIPISETKSSRNLHGIKISYADQSAFVNYYIHEMKVIFEDMGFNVELHRVQTPEQARGSGSPYGTFGVFMDGHFLTHKLLNKHGIEELIGSLDLNEMYPELEYLVVS